MQVCALNLAANYPPTQTPGRMNLLGVEIFAVGTWQGQKFTVADLKALVKASQGPVLLKLGHGPIPLPNPARADNTRLSDDGTRVLADFLDLPEVIGKAVELGLYRSVSVEVSKRIMGGPWILTAVAILGAETPEVKTLAGLQDAIAASETALTGISESALSAMFSMAEPNLTGAHEQDPTKGEDKVTPEEAAALKAKMAEMEKENAQLKMEGDAHKGELATFAAKEKEMHFTAARDQIMAPYEKNVEAGKVAPVFRNKVFAALEQQKANYNVGDALMLPAELVMEATQGLPLGEQAVDKAEGNAMSDSSDMELSAIAEKIAFEKSMNFSEAMIQAMKINPDLAKSYKDEPFHNVTDWR